MPKEARIVDPYRHGSLTKIKMVLPVGKRKAWRFIATPTGLASWLVHKCEGNIAPGEGLVLTWSEGRAERVDVVYVGEKHSSLQLQRHSGSRLRFYLHGRMTTLTLEVEYSEMKNWRGLQLSELANWAFALGNLKSIAMGGPDLRSRMPGRVRSKGFID